MEAPRPRPRPLSDPAPPHVYAVADGETEEASGLQATLELAPIGIAQFDAEGRLLLVNSRLCTILGYSRDELLKLTFHEITFPEERHACVVANAQLAAGTVQSYQLEKRFLRRDGSAVWTRVTVSAVRDRQGDVAFFVGVAEDISEQKAQDEERQAEQKRAERAIRESEARLRRISESGMIGVFYWSVSHEITDANDAFLKMLGYTREDLTAVRLNGVRLTPPRWAAVDALKMAEVMATGVASAWEKEFYASDGHAVPVLVAKALLESEEEHGIAICIDISERQAAAAERERLLRLERNARRDAERAAQMRDDLLAVVAHDLRNPLHTLQLSAAGAAEPATSNESRAHYADVTQRVVESMDRLIGELLDIGRIEAGSFPIAKAPVELRELLDEVVIRFQPQADAGTIVLTREDSCDLGTVMCDRDQMLRALSNLVGNAIKFTPPRGTVAIRSNRVGAVVEVSVDDTGMGISQDDLAHVFDRFWQADRTKRFGTGLGLVIAKGIVESHGGTIGAESVMGRGSCFRFTIPVTWKRPPRPAVT